MNRDLPAVGVDDKPEAPASDQTCSRGQAVGGYQCLGGGEDDAQGDGVEGGSSTLCLGCQCLGGGEDARQGNGAEGGQQGKGGGHEEDAGR